MIEDLLLHFKERYPGVYLQVQQECALSVETGKVTVRWTFWHAGAKQHVGPYPTPKALIVAVDAWEANGERKLAEEFEEAKKLDEERLAVLKAKREAKARLTPLDGPDDLPLADPHQIDMGEPVG